MSMTYASLKARLKILEDLYPELTEAPDDITVGLKVEWIDDRGLPDMAAGPVDGVGTVVDRTRREPIGIGRDRGRVSGIRLFSYPVNP